jgi:hypothetical protein
MNKEQDPLIEYAFFQLTKDEARAFLETRAPNRRINKHAIARMVDDMNNGRWVITHQCPAIDQEGRLTDGQHRLLAFVESTLDVFPTYIAYYNYPNRAMEVLDTMTARSIGHMLQITRDLTSAPTRAATAKVMMALQNNTSISRVSTSRTLAFVDANAEAIDFGVHALPNKVAIGMASVRGALAYLYSTRPNDREQLARYARVIRSGEYDEPGDVSAISLRNCLLTRRAGFGTGWGTGSTAIQRIAVATINTFDYFVARKRLSRIHIPK